MDYLTRKKKEWASLYIEYSLFDLKKENSRTRTSTLCAAICSFMEDQCNAFTFEAENQKCSLGTVRSLIILRITAMFNVGGMYHV